MIPKKFYTVMVSEGSKTKAMARYTIIVDKFKTKPKMAPVLMYFGEYGETPDQLEQRLKTE